MITASSTITQIAAPLARIPPLSWRDTRRVTDGRAGLIASRRGGVGAPPRATVPRRRCVVVTANGRHSRSKLREKEDARERARDAAYRDMRREETRDALVKVDDTEVINFLLSTEIIPLCLRTMEMGSELSKTVATFIVQKMLLDEVGLNYVCATAARFFAVSAVLGSMVQLLTEQPSVRLLKHIIRCYLRLSDNPRARDALKHCLPEQLRDLQFTSCLKDDLATKRWLAQLLLNVGLSSTNAQQNAM